MSVEALEQQIEESMVLQSVYGDENFYVDPDTIEKFQEWVDNQSNSKLPPDFPTLFFDITLLIPTANKDKITVRFDLPLAYPDTECCQVMVSSPSLAREIHSHLQSRVQEYMQQEGQNHSDGQRALGVFDIVTWITELLPSIAEMADAAEIEKRIEREVDTKAGGEEDKYVRQWMFFHHVYSKTKRIDIVAWAKELGLNGFLKSGKPGVVCLEGNDSAVREMLVIMGGWNWQIIKRKECHVISNSMESTGLQACFSGEGFLELKERDCGLVLEWLNTKSLGTEFMATLGLSYVP